MYSTIDFVEIIWGNNIVFYKLVTQVKIDECEVNNINNNGDE